MRSIGRISMLAVFSAVWFCGTGFSQQQGSETRQLKIIQDGTPIPWITNDIGDTKKTTQIEFGNIRLSIGNQWRTPQGIGIIKPTHAAVISLRIDRPSLDDDFDNEFMELCKKTMSETQVAFLAQLACKGIKQDITNLKRSKFIATKRP